MKSAYPIFYIFVVFITPLTSGCSNDDEPSVKDRICAKWNVTDIQFEVTIGGMSLTDYFIEVYDVSPEEAQAATEANENYYRESWTGTMEFKADGTYEFFVGGDHQENNWYLSDDNKTIHIYYINHYMDMDIVTLGEKKMTLRFDQIYYDDIIGDSNKEAIAYNNNFILEK